MKSLPRFFVGITLMALIVCCYSCGVENSEAEKKDAQQSMDKAKAVFAADLEASTWNDAMKAWEQGEAAVKEGKPSKTFYLRAKSRFDKAAAISKSRSDVYSKDISAMQTTISERLSKVKADIQRGKGSSKIQSQVKPLLAELDKGLPEIDSLVGQGSFSKASAMAKDLQTKVYNVELLIAGKKLKP
jgi:hypothetical protein